ncbi:MAG: hypothetical protein ACRBCS_04540 [Cellvibrionaceae bacterium]
MPELFLLQNQNKLFLSKQNEWVDGRDLSVIYKTEHRDEALNQLFETNTKDYGQRIHIISCPSNEKKLPVIDPDILPPPIPKAPKELADEENPQLDLAAVDTEDAHQDGSLEGAEVGSPEVESPEVESTKVENAEVENTELESSKLENTETENI